MTGSHQERSVTDAAWDNGVAVETYVVACEGPPFPLPACLLALSVAQSVAGALAYAAGEGAVAFATAVMSAACVVSCAVAAAHYFSSLSRWRSAMDECRRLASGGSSDRYSATDGGNDA